MAMRHLSTRKGGMAMFTQPDRLFCAGYAPVTILACPWEEFVRRS